MEVSEDKRKAAKFLVEEMFHSNEEIIKICS